jgi:class 3 adenylate cyclase
VLTDVEGSTRLLADLGYRETLGRPHAALREAFGRHDGYEVDNEGDSFFYAFASARRRRSGRARGDGCARR